MHGDGSGDAFSDHGAKLLKMVFVKQVFFSPSAQVGPLPQGRVLLEVQADQGGPRQHGDAVHETQRWRKLNRVHTCFQITSQEVSAGWTEQT